MAKKDNFTIAVITDDGSSVSRNFGCAGYYLVATVEAGRIVRRELRNKAGYGYIDDNPITNGHSGPTQANMHLVHAHQVQVVVTISDCEAVLCGGMCMGAYESMGTIGIRPIVTDLIDIDMAVTAYANGELLDRVERLQ